MMGETGPMGLHSKGRKTDMKTAAKRERKTLRIVELALLLGAAAFLMTGVWALNTQRDLADKVVRLHVLANSDTEEDQALKLLVRDAVLERATEILEQSADRQEAEARLRGQLLELETVLCRQAKKHQTAVMPGYTHLQRAQPISFAQHLMAYAAMFRRDVTRLEDCGARLDECPLGSGALAGTTYPIDRWETAKALGFAAPMGNSLDGVSDRDYALELLSGLSILMMHLSRFAEEVILWCSWEFKFIELDDAYATGSSIMPQKKNPDVAELVRGKTGRVYGDLMSLLTVMKGLPLAYNKDMQEDKEPVFDAVDTVEMCLPVFAAMLDTMTVRTDNMRKAAGHGFINATDCADYLTKKGMPFRDAYTVTGHLVAQCTARGKTLEELTLEELKAVSELFEADVYDALNLENCMALRSSYGGPAVAETARQIGEIEQFIQKIKENR